MFRAVAFLAVVGLALASYQKPVQRTYQPKPTPKVYKPTPKVYKPVDRCYQCEYRPPKTVTEVIQVPRQVEEKVARYVEDEDCYGYHCEPRLVYDVKVSTVYEDRTITKVIPAGGFEACMGPIDPKRAEADGVDVWDCKSNCYVRKDAEGNVIRGCYAGEFGVNPNMLGCHQQAGSTYCFCAGSKCNNRDMH